MELSVTVAGEKVSAAEIRFLLDQGSSLVFFRDRWIEVDRNLLKQALRALERGERTVSSPIGFALGIGRIGELEIENVKATIPLADFDSRLGFEPSLEYYCDVEHLEWKLRHMDRILTDDIPELEREGRVKNPTLMDYPRGVWQNMTDPT
jgi:hypothetical protein